MRDVKPPVNFKKLEIDSIDSFDVRRPHYKRVKALNKGIILLIILVIAILLIAGGLAVYALLLKNNPSADLSTSSGSQSSLSNSLTAQTLIAKAKVVVRGDVKQTMNDSAGKPYAIFNAPPYKPTGYNFSVRPEQDSGFGSYGTKDTIASDIVFIQKVFVDNNLSETILATGSQDSQFAARYESDAIICGLSDQKPYNEPATSTNYSVVIGCADKSSYLTNAAMLRPYFIVYTSQVRTDTTKMLLGSPTFKQSKTPGYTIASIAMGGSEYGSVGGFAALFYVTPDTVLHYFTGTQSELPCSKFMTDDLKKAYLGEQCYDEATGNDLATVKL
jgi:hypothetical protein